MILGAPASSAPASSLVAHGTFRNGGAAFTAINTTPANILFFAISSSHGSTPVPADSKSNTWILLVSDLVASPDIRLYYANPATVGTGHTFTVTGASTLFAATVAAFSGIASSPAGVSNHSHSASINPSLQTGSVTPGTSKSLIITTFGYATAAAYSIDLGFTISDQQTFVPANSYGNAMAFITQAGTAPLNPAWTPSVVSNVGTAAIGVFAST